MNALVEHYRAVNEADGHSTHCAWGAGADCTCGKHWTPCDRCGALVGPDCDLDPGYDGLAHADCGRTAAPVTLTPVNHYNDDEDVPF